MDLTIFDFNARPSLDRPVLLICLNGWVNAGSAATLVANTLGGDTIAVGNSDLLFDYRVSRPTLDFFDGVMTDMVWPDLTLRHRRVDSTDLLILSGTEPNWNWKRLANEMTELTAAFGVRMVITVGAVPWAWPHTRPVPIIVASSNAAYLPGSDERPRGLLRVPAAAVSALEYVLGGNGTPTLGFFARVPQYVGVEYPAAALALLERVSSQLGIELPTGELTEAARNQRTELDEVAAARTDLIDMIQKLEAMVDAAQAVSGEQLAAEIERYLRQQP